MPELPEVETVRAGLERWVTGRRIGTVEVLHPRAVRRHGAGSADFSTRLSGAVVDGVHRRGKYLWLSLSEDPLSADLSSEEPSAWPSALDRSRSRTCLVAHLGMSGQLLIQPATQPPPVHTRVRFRFTDGGPELRFVDQRTFGGLVLDALVPVAAMPGATASTGATVSTGARAGPPGDPETVPGLIAHIARDPLDPAFDDLAWQGRVRRRHSAVKRILLDQSVISGVGNIYADEALWRARLHGLRWADGLRPAAWVDLLAAIRAVLTEALAQGGTSFDALYVDVNGQSGYFDRSLAVYGRAGRPCPRCGTPIRRSPFMNRSSFWCPSCQRPPRAPRAVSSSAS